MDNKIREGWLIIASLAWICFLIFGTTFGSISLFCASLEAAFPNSKHDVALATSLFLLTMTLSMPVAGFLLDRIATWRVMMSGLLLVCCGYWLASCGTSMTLIKYSFALVGFGVGASTYVPALKSAADWIDEPRALAFGIILGASSAGMATFPWLAAQAIAHFGWRHTMAGAAALMIASTAPVLWYCATRRPIYTGERPADAPGKISVGYYLRAPRFWRLTALQMCASFGYMGIYFSVVPFVSGLGYSADDAALLLCCIGIASVAGYVVFGSLSERIGPAKALSLGLLLSSIAPLLLWFAEGAHGLVVLLFFVAAWGATSNLYSQFAPVLLAQSFGLSGFGRLLGLSNLAVGIAGAVAPVAAARVAEIVDGPRAVFALFAAVTAIALVALIPMEADDCREEDYSISTQ